METKNPSVENFICLPQKLPTFPCVLFAHLLGGAYLLVPVAVESTEEMQLEPFCAFSTVVTEVGTSRGRRQSFSISKVDVH